MESTNFDNLQLSNPSSDFNLQYLIWKIQSISVWSQKLKREEWVLDTFLGSQNTPKFLHKLQIAQVYDPLFRL